LKRTDGRTNTHGNVDVAATRDKRRRTDAANYIRGVCPSVYKKAISRAKRESWQRFCNGINGPSSAARLFKLLGKDHTYSIDSIRLPDGSICDNTEEALKYLLDTHFPGKNHKYQNIRIETTRPLTRTGK